MAKDAISGGRTRRKQKRKLTNLSFCWLTIWLLLQYCSTVTAAGGKCQHENCVNHWGSSIRAYELKQIYRKEIFLHACTTLSILKAEQQKVDFSNVDFNLKRDHMNFHNILKNSKTNTSSNFPTSNHNWYSNFSFSIFLTWKYDQDTLSSIIISCCKSDSIYDGELGQEMLFLYWFICLHSVFLLYYIRPSYTTKKSHIDHFFHINLKHSEQLFITISSITTCSTI